MEDKTDKMICNHQRPKRPRGHMRTLCLKRKLPVLIFFADFWCGPCPIVVSDLEQPTLAECLMSICGPSFGGGRRTCCLLGRLCGLDVSDFGQRFKHFGKMQQIVKLLCQQTNTWQDDVGIYMLTHGWHAKRFGPRRAVQKHILAE